MGPKVDSAAGSGKKSVANSAAIVISEKVIGKVDDCSEFQTDTAVKKSGETQVELG